MKIAAYGSIWARPTTMKLGRSHKVCQLASLTCNAPNDRRAEQWPIASGSRSRIPAETCSLRMNCGSLAANASQYHGSTPGGVVSSYEIALTADFDGDPNLAAGVNTGGDSAWSQHLPSPARDVLPGLCRQMEGPVLRILTIWCSHPALEVSAVYFRRAASKPEAILNR
jgi:hypothetical protein